MKTGHLGRSTSTRSFKQAEGCLDGFSQVALSGDNISLKDLVHNLPTSHNHQVTGIQYPSQKPSTKSGPFPHHHQLWVVDHLHSLSIFISGMAPSQDFSGTWRFSPGCTDLRMYRNVILVVLIASMEGTYPMFVCIYSSTQFLSRF